MSEVINKIKEKLSEFEDRKKVLIQEIRKDFPEVISELLNQSDSIKSVGWAQYTPYFNDGDTCEFSANIDYLYVNGEDSEDASILSPFKHGKIKDEHDLLMHRELCAATNKSWLKTRKIGEDGLLPNPNYVKKESEIFNEIKIALSSISTDFYRDLFGDHCMVTIYKGGKLDVSEYEHE